MPLPAVAVAAAAAAEASGILQQAWDVANSGEAAYIRDGQASGVIPKLGLAMARATCRRYAANPGGYSDAATARMEGACAPYLAAIGDGSPPDVGGGMVGGQCPGVTYRAVGTITPVGSFCASGGVVTSTPLNVNTLVGVGPITSVRDNGVVASCRDGFRLRQIVCTNGAGVDIVIAEIGSSAQTTIGYRESNRSLTFVRADGLPDTCGNAPPVVVPRQPPVSPRPPTAPFFDPDGVDVPLTVNIDADGTVTVDIGTGPITIDPFSDGGGGGGSGSGGSVAPGDQGQPGSPSVTGPGGEDSGEAPAGSVLAGLLVTSITTTRDVSEFAANVIRGVGYIYMGGDAGLDLVPAGAALREGQFVIAPVDYLTKWRVNANVGFDIGVTPYYREVSE